MERHNYNKQHTLNSLISEYEAMSQKGTVVFYEETVFSDLIDYYQNEEEYEAALAVADIAISQHSFSAFLYYRKAQLLYFLCHKSYLEEALVMLERAESLSPNDLAITLLKIQLLAKLENYAVAFSLLHTLKQSILKYDVAEQAEIFYCEGLLLERLGEYEGMYAIWEEALLMNTRHPEILQRIWICIERSQKYEDAGRLFQRIIDRDPYCHLAWFYFGHTLSYKGEYNSAIEAYEYAFIIDNEFEEAYKECAANCLILKDYAKALDCYQEALKYIDPDGELLFNIGQCYESLGNEMVALSFYHKAVDVDAYNDEVYFHIGNCMINQQRWTSAIHYFKRAISLDNRREEYYSALALVYYNLEELEKAFNCFSKATELAPEEPKFWVDFATFLIQVGYIEEALAVLEQADNHSYGAALLYCKVACYYKLGRDKKAIDILAEALEENYEEYCILLTLLPELKNNKTYQSVLRYFKKD